MSDNPKVSCSCNGLGIAALIATSIMAIAKLFGHFDQTWWIVFSPVLVVAGIELGIIIGVLVVGAIMVVLDK